MPRPPLAFIALLLLAACARSEDASAPVDFNAMAPAIERPAQRAQEEEEIAIGEWRDSLQDEFAALEFGPSGAPPLFSLRCAEDRGVLLQRHGAVPSGDLPTMVVSVGSDSRRLAVTASGGAVPMLRAALASDDALLRAIAGAAVPIVVRIGDSVALALPPAPAIGTFVARCAGANQPAAETNATAPAAANQAQPASTNMAR